MFHLGLCGSSELLGCLELSRVILAIHCADGKKANLWAWVGGPVVYSIDFKKLSVPGILW